MKLLQSHRHVPVTACIAALFELSSRCYGRRYVRSYAKFCRGHMT